MKRGWVMGVIFLIGVITILVLLPINMLYSHFAIFNPIFKTLRIDITYFSYEELERYIQKIKSNTKWLESQSTLRLALFPYLLKNKPDFKFYKENK